MDASKWITSNFDFSWGSTSCAKPSMTWPLDYRNIKKHVKEQNDANKKEKHMLKSKLLRPRPLRNVAESLARLSLGAGSVQWSPLQHRPPQGARQNTSEVAIALFKGIQTGYGKRVSIEHCTNMLLIAIAWEEKPGEI